MKKCKGIWIIDRVTKKPIRLEKRCKSCKRQDDTQEKALVFKLGCPIDSDNKTCQFYRP